MIEENNKVLFKLKKQGDQNFTLHELNHYLGKIEEVTNETNKKSIICKRYSTNDFSPEIVSVDNGCIEILISFACAVAAGLAEHYLEKLIENIIKKFKSVEVHKDDTCIVEVTAENTWSYFDDYEITNTIIKTYAINKSAESVAVFLKRMNEIAAKYGEASVKCKISNTKYLLEKHNINNTLKCSPLSKHSKRHEMVFVDLCKRYGIL